MIVIRRAGTVLILLGVVCVAVACATQGPTTNPSRYATDAGAPPPPAPPPPPPAPDAGPTGTGTDSCVHTGPPVLDPTTFPACPMCVDGHCLPSSLIPPESAGDLADCDATSKCVPDLFLETGGMFLLATCESIGGIEGRCMSTCLPQIAEQADLPQSTCTANERCAPCFDPTTGMATPVCEQGCDTGPAMPPPMVQHCCEDRGTCIASEVVPADDRDQLSADSCMGDFLCIPDVLSGAGGASPQSCDTLFGAGGCLPDCIPSLSEGLAGFFVDQSNCPDGYLCAPCEDFLTGEPSGACR